MSNEPKKEKAIVTAFWDNVDGGYCTNCSADAIRAFCSVFKEYDVEHMLEVLEEVSNE